MSLSTMLTFIKDSLKDEKGYPSSMRVNIFIGFAQWSLAITIGFLWVLFWYPDIILGYLITLSSLVSGLVGLKVYQKKVENTSTPNGQDGDIDTTKKTDTTNKE